MRWYPELETARWTLSGTLSTPCPNLFGTCLKPFPGLENCPQDLPKPCPWNSSQSLKLAQTSSHSGVLQCFGQTHTRYNYNTMPWSMLIASKLLEAALPCSPEASGFRSPNWFSPRHSCRQPASKPELIDPKEIECFNVSELVFEYHTYTHTTNKIYFQSIPIPRKKTHACILYIWGLIICRPMQPTSTGK